MAPAGIRQFRTLFRGTRRSLITGRYQDRLLVGLDEPLVDRDVGLPPAQPTLPFLLEKAGYRTTFVGKWHLGQPPKFGLLQSGYDRYDHFCGFRGGGAWITSITPISATICGTMTSWCKDARSK